MSGIRPLTVRRSGDGYVIPINKALEIAHQIEAGQSSTNVHIGDRALLGVQVQDTAAGPSVIRPVPSTSQRFDHVELSAQV